MCHIKTGSDLIRFFFSVNDKQLRNEIIITKDLIDE